MEWGALSEALIRGDAKTTGAMAREAVEAGASPADVLHLGLVPGMAVIGERFRKNEVYVPEVLIAARAMNAALAVLRPLMTESDLKGVGTVVIGTVKGDLHDIGKNLVSMMLEGAGFRVVDLGVDVPPERFVQAVKDENPQIVALSALLTTTMGAMQATIKAIEEAGLSVKVMVGGAPVTSDFANSIGADGYAPEASTAVDIAKALVG